VQSSQQFPIAGVLVVRERAAGPVVFAKWRDGERAQVMRRLGRAWLVPAGDSRARARGARVGDWVERRGRAPEGVLDVRSAHDAMRRAIDERELQVLQERQRAARVRETGVTVRRAAQAWLDDGRTEREWKHSTAHDYAKVADRICRALGDLPLETVTEDELRAFLGAVTPELNGKPLDRAPSTRAPTEVPARHPRDLQDRRGPRLDRRQPGGAVAGAA